MTASPKPIVRTAPRVQQRRGKLSALQIARAFAKLGLQQRGSDPYSGATIFAQQFRRCSVLADADVTFAANSGI